jgi:Ca2+-binding EF-hand superfamily protein
MRIAFVILCLASLCAPLSAQESDDAEALTRADFVVRMDAEFSRLDRDGSRVLLPEEIEAVQRDAARAEALRQNQQVFVGLDKDANGMLDPQEFAALANPDAIPVNATPLMTQFDTDRDGAVTLVEHRIVTQGNFDRIDTDRDGVVTPLEMRAAGIKP